MKNNQSIIPTERIVNRILIIRDKKVMLDKDLAELYGVKPIRLREQVKRNKERFPEDFMFQLNKEEVDILVSQFAIPSKKHLGGYLPYVFTEHGVLMLSNVIKSSTAVNVSIAIVRTFAKLKEMLTTDKNMRKKIETMEKKYDKQFKAVFDAIKQLIIQEKKPKREIGFKSNK